MRSVTANGVTVQYELTYKSVKNLNLRVKRDGSVHVSAPKRTPLERVDDFVLRNLAFIQRAQARLQAKSAPQDGIVYYMGQRYTLAEQPSAKNGVRFEGDRVIVLTTNHGDAAHREKILAAYENAVAKELFPKVVAGVLPLLKEYGVKMPAVTARRMTSRWGSCTMAKGSIRLNTELIHYPVACIEQVVLHELCHFVHGDHSKDFYALLMRLMPDWRERKRLLEHGMPKG